MSSVPKSMSSVREARELYDLKEKAAKFYAENGVPKKMEEILNSMFYDNPPDVYGHLVNFFQGFAKPPTITKLKACKAFDSKGQTAIQTDLHCIVNNKEKLLSSTVSSSVSPTVLEIAKPEELEEECKEREQNVNEAIQILNTKICTELQGFDPLNQNEADALVTGIIKDLKAAEDEKLAQEAENKESTDDAADDKKPGSGLSKGDKPKSANSKNKDKGKGKGGKGGAPVVVVPDEPKEKMLCGSNCISAVSKTICMAGAEIQGVPLYEYISTLKYGQTQKQYRMPLPMVTIFLSGRTAPGKSSCIKEYMLVPSPDKPLNETIPMIVAVYNDLTKSILNKSGVQAKNITDIGALMVSFDRPEQGLDLIQESMTRLELKPGEDLCIALNLAGHEIFDYSVPPNVDEKGKYEVITGQQKVADDMVDFWAELLGRYPAVMAIIDPLRKQEDRQWMMLCERLSEKLYIIGDNVWHRPGLLKDEELQESFKSSGVVFKLESMNTVSDIITCAKKMEDNSNETVLSCGIGDSPDSVLVDLAVGMKARFIKIGAPCRGERVCKLNRLLAIETSLKDCDKLSPLEGFQFPTITLPPPPPEEESAEVDQPEVKESPKKK
ncbi:Enolase [Mactra antiquata]